jgi:type II secretory pathway pseudopilin PulG
VVLGLALVVSGIAAALFAPSFIRFQARARQAECRSNLKILVGQRERVQTPGGLQTLMEQMSLLQGNRYAYVSQLPQEVVPPAPRHPQPSTGALGAAFDAAGVQPGIEGECPDCTLTVACVGNLDTDATLDVWSVSTTERTDAAGGAIPAGMPFNHVNDLAQ